jgi:hypothetical protein
MRFAIRGYGDAGTDAKCKTVLPAALAPLVVSVTAGMGVADTTHITAIPTGATVVSVTATTITISSPVGVTITDTTPGCTRLPMAQARAQHVVFLARTQTAAQTLKRSPSPRARRWARESQEYKVLPRLRQNSTPTRWEDPARRPLIQMLPTSPRSSRIWDFSSRR